MKSLTFYFLAAIFAASACIILAICRNEIAEESFMAEKASLLMRIEQLEKSASDKYQEGYHAAMEYYADEQARQECLTN